MVSWSFFSWTWLWLWLLLWQQLSLSLVTSQCVYVSNGAQLSLNVLSGQVFAWTDVETGFKYSWSPCTNGISCTSSSMGTSMVMGAQLNTYNGNCNKIGVWNSSVGAIYDSAAQTWSLWYPNGSPCGSYQVLRTLSLSLLCAPTGTNRLTSVNNPANTCEYDYYASGPGFCPTFVSTTSPPPTTSTTSTPSTTRCTTSTVTVCSEGAPNNCTTSIVTICSGDDDSSDSSDSNDGNSSVNTGYGDDNGDHNDHNDDNSKKIGKAFFIISIMVGLFCLYTIIGYFCNKTFVYPHFPWNDWRHQMVHITCCCRCCYPHLFPPSSSSFSSSSEGSTAAYIINTQDNL